jgi:outer membrane lipopolysaccharide assembly protein LptE/RlpB
MKRLAAYLLLTLLAACDGGLWNNPYPATDAGHSILYTRSPNGPSTASLRKPTARMNTSSFPVFMRHRCNITI